MKIYLEESELKWIELQAHGNVSKWCRERIIEDCPVSSVREDAAIPAPDRREPVARQVDGTKQCVHGTLKGYRCWQCGGLAKD